MENGREVTQTKHVNIAAGANVTVEFPTSSENTEQTAPPR